MSCYSIVRLNLEIKAAPDEIAEAARAMGLAVQSKTATAVGCGNVLFSRVDANTNWTVSGASTFDATQFRREVARAKVLAEAKRQGYRVTRDERQGDKLVIRMKVG